LIGFEIPLALLGTNSYMVPVWLKTSKSSIEDGRNALDGTTVLPNALKTALELLHLPDS
jgi:hypothetical protein